MKRTNGHESSTVTSRSFGRMTRVGAVIVASLIAIAMALAMSGATQALAADVDQNDRAGAAVVEKARNQRANNLTGGQIASAGSATVLVYMNGSDLESEAGEATADIAEMIESGIGDNVNVVIETIGTREWQDFGIASDRTQRYRVNNGSLELVDDSLGQLDTTDPETLSDFISWGVKNYPADRYFLLLWDHGAGPVYGFGYDEFQGDYAALTLDEMKQVLEANSDVHFDIIGMDCCIMASLETCAVLQPFCDYTVLSEDFEPGIGWSYTRWMSALEKNPGIDTVELGKMIVDDMIKDVEADEENGDATLALIDESKVPALYSAWIDFAYANEEALLASDFSQEIEWRGRPGHSMGSMGGSSHGLPSQGGSSLDSQDSHDSHGQGSMASWFEGWDDWAYDNSYVTMTDYFVTDIAQVASSIDGDEAAVLSAALDQAITHFDSTADEVGMAGLGVTLPYGDAEFYGELVKVFTACGIDGSYVDWLESFVGASSVKNGFGTDGDSCGYEGYENSYGHDGGYESGSDYGFGGGYGLDGGFGFSFGNGSGSSYGDGYDYGYSSGYDDGYGPGYSPSYNYGYGYGSSSSHGYDYGYGSGSSSSSSHGYDYGCSHRDAACMCP